jgi:hypothetical protein
MLRMVPVGARLAQQCFLRHCWASQQWHPPPHFAVLLWYAVEQRLKLNRPSKKNGVLRTYSHAQHLSTHNVVIAS